MSPIEFLLFDSNIKNRDVANVINILVAISTIFECNVYFLKLNLFSHISFQTTNPSPPIIINEARVSKADGLLANDTMLWN